MWKGAAGYVDAVCLCRRGGCYVCVGEGLLSMWVSLFGWGLVAAPRDTAHAPSEGHSAQLQLQPPPPP